MPILALLGIVLLVLALLHVIPLLVGVILGLVLIVIGGVGWYGGGRARL
jgi:hypothetical protein